MHVLVHGNPFDGLEIVGPFEDADQVAAYAETHGSIRNDTWWAMSVLAPDKEWLKDWSIYHGDESDGEDR